MIRIIPRLDVKGPNLVKGIHLEGLRVLGSPEEFAKYYYENGADELIFQDVVASLYERNSLHDIISRVAKNMFIPLTVGGGLRTISDVKQVLRAGADKVTINTAAIRNPAFVSEASKKFGASTIVIAIEAIKQTNGKYYAFIDNGREETGLEVVQWARKVEELGAGEIVITSVDRDGTGEGFDIELIKQICSQISIPVIVHGGASKLENMKVVSDVGGVGGLAIGSTFHYASFNKLSNGVELNLEGNKSFLKRGASYGKITPMTIEDVKNYLNFNNIPCRPIIQNQNE
jgi:cyclase